MKKQSKLKVRTNVLHHGSDNAIVRRVALQFFELLRTGMFEIPADRVAKIEEELLRCMEELLHMQDALSQFVSVEDEHVRRVQSGEGLDLQDQAIAFDDPTAGLKKLFGDFVMRGVIALRRLRKVAELGFGLPLKKGNALKEHLLRLLPESDEDHRKWIQEDDVWIKELIDLRGDVEHETFDIGPFDVDIDDTGQPVVQLTCYPTKAVALREFMRATLYNVFTHCEDTIALMLNSKGKGLVAVIQLPEEERARHQGYRYVLHLKHPPLIQP